MDPAPPDLTVMGATAEDSATLLRSVADRLDRLAAGSTAGDWRPAGLLATRPEVVAHRADGGTEHVAEARSASAAWITALSPAVAAPLSALLRSVADARPAADPPVVSAAVELANVLLSRMEGHSLGISSFDA